MGRLRVLSGREVRAILEANGFKFSRQRGSHMIMVLQLEADSRTVSVPEHKEVATGTLGGIIRESGLPRALFEA
jgi:predicted RNA binding protein YcfA (HicA-like mRNA interferase family)